MFNTSQYPYRGLGALTVPVSPTLIAPSTSLPSNFTDSSGTKITAPLVRPAITTLPRIITPPGTPGIPRLPIKTPTPIAVDDEDEILLEEPPTVITPPGSTPGTTPGFAPAVEPQPASNMKTYLIIGGIALAAFFIFRKK